MLTANESILRAARKSDEMLEPYEWKRSRTVLRRERASNRPDLADYSLVYFGVNMAESIRNQLAGGEPTFDTSSLKGGGFGGGKGGGFRQGEQPEDENGVPAFAGREKRPEGGNKKSGLPGMPGMEGGRQIDFREYLPEMAVYGGVFAAGLVFALAFRRKKRLKEPEKWE